MFNLSKKYLILAGLSLIATATLIISLLFRNSTPPPPILLESNPAEGVTNASVYDPIFFQFGSPILIENITATSQPTEHWDLNQKNSSTISLSHDSPLTPNTQYTITLFMSNKPLTNLTFTTKTSQTDYPLLQNIADEVNRDYPLAKQTPHETTAYRVVYISPMTLEITLKTNSLTEQEAISQVKSWVTKNGGDSSAHKYQVILAPNPSPTTTPTPQEELSDL